VPRLLNEPSISHSGRAIHAMPGRAGKRWNRLASLFKERSARPPARVTIALRNTRVLRLHEIVVSGVFSRQKA
jgi:hypothetical protein